MSIKKRLLNVAKAELRNAAKKAGSLFDGSADPDDRLVDEELEKLAREETEKRTRKPAKKAYGEPAHIRKYYANLELPIGASAAEVKASYRRLMRRYHPDLHQNDQEKAALATRLAQELRVAYEGLIAYLEPPSR